MHNGHFYSRQVQVRVEVLGDDGRFARGICPSEAANGTSRKPPRHGHYLRILAADYHTEV